jgi:hypothetical protein
MLTRDERSAIVIIMPKPYARMKRRPDARKEKHPRSSKMRKDFELRKTRQRRHVFRYPRSIIQPAPDVSDIISHHLIFPLSLAPLPLLLVS